MGDRNERRREAWRVRTPEEIAADTERQRAARLRRETPEVVAARNERARARRAAETEEQRTARNAARRGRRAVRVNENPQVHVDEAAYARIRRQNLAEEQRDIERRRNNQQMREARRNWTEEQRNNYRLRRLAERNAWTPQQRAAHNAQRRQNRPQRTPAERERDCRRMRARWRAMDFDQREEYNRLRRERYRVDPEYRARRIGRKTQQKRQERFRRVADVVARLNAFDAHEEFAYRNRLFDYGERRIFPIQEEERRHVERNTRMDDPNSDFRALRRARIPCTKIARIVRNRVADLRVLAHEMMHVGSNGSFETDAMRKGKELEAAAIQSFMAERNIEEFDFGGGFVLHPQLGFVGATPDSTYTENGQTKVLEVKYSSTDLTQGKTYLSREINIGAGNFADRQQQQNLPQFQLSRTHPYYFQLVTQIICTEAREGTLLAYHDNVDDPAQWQMWYQTITLAEATAMWDNIIQPSIIVFYLDHFVSPDLHEFYDRFDPLVFVVGPFDDDDDNYVPEDDDYEFDDSDSDFFTSEDEDEPEDPRGGGGPGGPGGFGGRGPQRRGGDGDEDAGRGGRGGPGLQGPGRGRGPGGPGRRGGGRGRGQRPESSSGSDSDFEPPRHYRRIEEQGEVLRPTGRPDAEVPDVYRDNCYPEPEFEDLYSESEGASSAYGERDVRYDGALHPIVNEGTVRGLISRFTGFVASQAAQVRQGLVNMRDQYREKRDQYRETRARKKAEQAEFDAAIQRAQDYARAFRLRTAQHNRGTSNLNGFWERKEEADRRQKEEKTRQNNEQQKAFRRSAGTQGYFPTNPAVFSRHNRPQPTYEAVYEEPQPPMRPSGGPGTTAFWDIMSGGTTEPQSRNEGVASLRNVPGVVAPPPGTPAPPPPPQGTPAPPPLPPRTEPPPLPPRNNSNENNDNERRNGGSGLNPYRWQNPANMN